MPSSSDSSTVSDPYDMRTFYTLAFTQVFSLIGSRMTGIALGIWVFQDTGDATPVLMATMFSQLPMMLAGSLGGVWADRLSRRRAIILADAGQALGTLLLILSFFTGRFEYWQLYTVMFWQGLLGMIQRPAADASVTMLVPESLRDRANAIRQLTGPMAAMIAPVSTGFLYAIVGLTGIMAVDMVTFVVAVVVVYFAHIPEPVQSAEGAVSSGGTMWQEALGALNFLWERKVLFGMLLFGAAINFFLNGPINLSTPYIITLTGSEELLGLLLGLMNAGVLVGGVLMGIFGGTRPRIHGIMLGLMFRGLALAVYGVVRTPVTLGIALFFLLFTNPLVDGSMMSLLQQKVPADMQGRVFAFLYQLMFIANPLSLAVTGPLVDEYLEPAVGGSGWSLIAPLVGSQPGSGMGLLLVVAGAAILVLTAVVYALPQVRTMEEKLPDYDVAAKPTEAGVQEPLQAGS